MSKNIIVVAANGPAELAAALELCELNLESREIALSFEPT